MQIPSRRLRSILIVTATLLGVSRLALATPAAPGWREIPQPDGAPIVVSAWGDEWSNGLETPSGHTVLRDSAGWWRYAERADDGLLEPTGPVVGTEPAPASLQPHLRRPSPERATRMTAAPGAVSPVRSGSHPLLVLVVNFTPSTSRGTTASQWRDHFFGTSQSVAHFWSIASHGRVSFVPATESQGTVNDGIVEVTLGTAHPDTADMVDSRNHQITRDAVLAANSFVDFASYDTNSSASLDTDELHLFIVVRGAEAAYGSDPCGPTVWGHRWCVSGAPAPPVVDGVSVASCSAGTADGARGAYIQIGEAHCTLAQPNRIATIGISAHELGHDLGAGLPDLYDYDDSHAGVGDWSLMAGGSWNWVAGGEQGGMPALPDAWCRWFLGALTPTQVTSTQAISLPQVTSAGGTSHGVFQLLPNPGGVEVGGSGEYFLLENRQLASYDAGLPGAGLLIWHVDESRDGNENEGTSPSSDRRLLALVQADGEHDLEGYFGAFNSGDAGDPWRAPAATRFAADTTPGTLLHDGTFAALSVSSIGASTATMAATVTISGGTGGCTLTGDADGNGSRSDADVAAVRQAVLAGTAPASPACAALRCDGSLDVTDVILLRRALAGLDSWGAPCP